MILDRLDQIGTYAALHPRLAEAIAFLTHTNLRDLPLGKQAIDGDKLFVLVGRDQARTRDQAKLEAHRNYIDIQVVLAGTDNMGWKSKPTCSRVDTPYDATKDCELFTDEPDAWVPVAADSFAIFFPEDAHAPLVGAGELHKVVVKVAV